jgi:predicted nucleic-acid-binding Zn-ribbon protein
MKGDDGMEYHDDKCVVTFGIAKCNKCGNENSYDVSRLNVSANYGGFFRATCVHCGASNVYHVNSIEYEMRTVTDEFEIVEDV